MCRNQIYISKMGKSLIFLTLFTFLIFISPIPLRSASGGLLDRIRPNWPLPVKPCPTCGAGIEPGDGGGGGGGGGSGADTNIDGTPAQAWEQTYGTEVHDSGTSIISDADGNLYIVGMSGGDLRVIKYNSDGSFAWDDLRSGGTSEILTDVAFDSQGNLIAVGWIQQQQKYGMIKYDTVAQQWGTPILLDCPTGGFASGVEVDADDNVIINGYARTTDDGINYYNIGYTLKTTQDGTVLWSKEFGSGTGLDHHTGSVALDSQGNVVVSGYSKVADGSMQLAVVKYDSLTGNETWSATKPISGHNTIGASVAVDSNDNIIIGGSAVATTGPSNADFLVVKYDASDDYNEAWSEAYHEGIYEYVRSMDVDSNGNVVVTGYSASLGNGYNYLTVAYGADGTRLWEERKDFTADAKSSLPSSVTITDQNKVVVTGYTEVDGLTNDYDITTVQYDIE